MNKSKDQRLISNNKINELENKINELNNEYAEKIQYLMYHM